MSKKGFNWLILACVLLLSTPVAAQQDKKPLTNEDIIKMVKAGLSENTIVLAIQKSSNKFDTSPEALIALKEAGATPKVLDAILQVNANPMPGSKELSEPQTTSDTTDSTGELVSLCRHSFGVAILNKWKRLGGVGSVLGCPTSDELLAEKSPQGTTGRYVEFDGNMPRTTENGAIYWHRTGRYKGQTFVVYGGIYNLYEDMGRSSSWLGFPISDEYDASGGRRSDFEGGYIFWDPWIGVSRAYKYK